MLPETRGARLVAQRLKQDQGAAADAMTTALRVGRVVRCRRHCRRRGGGRPHAVRRGENQPRCATLERVAGEDDSAQRPAAAGRSRDRRSAPGRGARPRLELEAGSILEIGVRAHAHRAAAAGCLWSVVQQPEEVIRTHSSALGEVIWWQRRLCVVSRRCACKSSKSGERDVDRGTKF